MRIGRYRDRAYVVSGFGSNEAEVAYAFFTKNIDNADSAAAMFDRVECASLRPRKYFYIRCPLLTRVFHL